MLTFKAKVLELWQFIPITATSILITFHFCHFIDSHGDVDIACFLQVKKLRPRPLVTDKNRISGGC